MLYSFTIFLSAFLLFQIQLIAAKHLLPWFGGSPAVWGTCQVFFQIVLLGGYAYAHRLGTLRRPGAQGLFHLGFLVFAGVGLVVLTAVSGHPLLAPESMKPDGVDQPIAQLLLILLTTVGLPFLCLSATGPLLQRWHSLRGDALGRTYRLYAYSNAGSLLGILLYPFGVEPLFDLGQQTWIWASLFGCFLVSCGVLAWRTRSLPDVTGGDSAEIGSSASLEVGSSLLSARARIGLWLALPFASSAMFLATTNQLCQEVAVVPFLWVLPLTIYLLTLIVCFDRPQWYHRRTFMLGFALTSVAILPITFLNRSFPIPLQILAYSALLLFFCMICHGELTRLRPGSSRLTLFYLLVAVGGAAGGTFVSLVAPEVFFDVWEFHLMLAVGWVLAGAVWVLDRESALHKGEPWYFGAAVFLATSTGVYVLAAFPLLSSYAGRLRDRIGLSIAAASVVTIVALLLSRRSTVRGLAVWPRLLVLLLVLLTCDALLTRVRDSTRGVFFIKRNFYGVVRIVALNNRQGQVVAHQMIHGITSHGLQFIQPGQTRIPTAYFSPSSGMGLAARELTRGNRPDVSAKSLHLGILGMGVGTIGAYARSGDKVRYYEINPVVIETAHGPNAYFSFLRECAGTVSVVAGDARLELERELKLDGSQGFDLLAMDAFSSDAVPVHLLTEEAFRLYASHLRDDSAVLAVNITNRFLDLEPVVAANARLLGFHGIRIDSPGDNPAPSPSTWALLSRDSAVLDRISRQAQLSRKLVEREVRFTDGYSNLFRVLK
jgi:hypothetical protein